MKDQFQITVACILFGFMFTLFAAQNSSLLINMNGELKVNGSGSWNKKWFQANGYEVIKDTEYYISEGQLSDDPDQNYYIYIKRGDKYILIIEVVDSSVFRISSRSPSVKLKLGDEDGRYLRVGMKINDALSRLGEYNYEYGEMPGLFLLPVRTNKVSLYTECEPDPEKVKGKSEVMSFLMSNKCVVNTINAIGDQGKLWDKSN